MKFSNNKKCSISLIIKEMQIKTTLRSLFTPAKTAVIKKSENKCYRGWRERGTFYLKMYIAIIESSMEVKIKDKM